MKGGRSTMSTRKICVVPLLLALVLALLWGASGASAGTNDTLRIVAAHGSIPTGAEDLVGGRLLTNTGRPIEKGRVTIDYAYPGERQWHPMTTFETNSNGIYGQRYIIPGTVYFRARFTGGGGYSATATNAVKVVGLGTVPADGTEYVDPANGCAYLVENGAWVGKYCLSQQVDSSGNTIPDMYNMYEFNAASTNHVGNYILEEYTGDPKFNEFRMPNLSIFQTAAWAAIPKATPTAEPVWEVPLAGKWTWVSTTQLISLLNTQAAAAAGQQAAPPASSTVTISGADSYTPAAYQDLVTGVRSVGGNAQLGASVSYLDTNTVLEPFDATICGEVNYVCWNY
jgi:hypothetical protein